MATARYRFARYRIRPRSKYGGPASSCELLPPQAIHAQQRIELALCQVLSLIDALPLLKSEREPAHVRQNAARAFCGALKALLAVLKGNPRARLRDQLKGAI